jgi:hypothetical protein
MLQARRGRAPAVKVSLAGGAFAMVRPATTHEVDLAIDAATNMLADLIDEKEKASAVVALLGEEYGSGDFTVPAWSSSAANRIALLTLGMDCIESWSGVGDFDGNPTEKPTIEVLACILRSPKAARRIGDVINSEVNIEIAEKNELSSLQPGAGAGGEGIARTADGPAPTAQQENE